MKSSSPGGRASGTGREFWLMLLLLAVLVTLFFGRSFLPGHTIFSNDGPLGRMVSQCHQVPAAFTGVWEDLNSVGYREPGALPNITYTLRLLLHPVGFSKFYVPVALTILGLSAWCFCRQAGLAGPASVLGGLAAMLNSEFFSTACWGVAADPLAVAMCFFAMALLFKSSSRRGWARVALAGLAVGMGLAEGADFGAIFSLYVAAFIMYQAWIEQGGHAKNLGIGAARVAVVAALAALLAAQALSVLVNTQIEGVTGAQQDAQTKEKRWDWATQWSLPKTETLSLIVPGLFGYRLDTIGGGEYWGAIGRHASWDRYFAGGESGKAPASLIRQTGGGIYAGVTVVLVALWAVAQALRRKDSGLDFIQRRWVWFWMGVGIVSLPLAFGRFAPFYKLLYSLPYFSTIRNPVKFVAVVNLALVVLFAYGVDGLWRNYLQPKKPGMAAQIAASERFNHFWIYGCGAVLALALVGWLIYGNSQVALVEYLVTNMISEGKAQIIAQFSVAQVGWFVLFFSLAAGVVALAITGHLRGTGHTRPGVVLLGLVLVLDLGRANIPWLVDWDYQQKYATNPVIDFLREKPYEARVTIDPFQAPAELVLENLYRYEWAQQQFQYYNIQSLDVVQMSRVPQDLEAFQKATFFDGTPATARNRLRRWELTNTRYIIGLTANIDALNNEFDPVQRQIKVGKRFNIEMRHGTERTLQNLTAQFSPQGRFALFDFTGALPRAKLYSNWQVNTNNEATLAELGNLSFNPWASVFVAGGVEPPSASAAADTNQDAGTVDFASYQPKDVVLNADVKVKSVLLLNDRFDPNWKALVDGKPAPLLRCNYVMRGVYLEPGTHKVEFEFRPPVRALYVSVAAVGLGLVLLGIVLAEKPVSKAPATPEPLPKPQPAENLPPKNPNPATTANAPAGTKTNASGNAGTKAKNKPAGQKPRR